MIRPMRRPVTPLAGLFAGVAAPSAAASADLLPTGQHLTPQAARGAIFRRLNPDLPELPAFTAGQASAVALSPDRRTLLILTSGYNRNAGADGKQVPSLSNEYVFVFDVSGATPVKRQVLQVPNTFLGIAWAPSGERFYVSAGVDDAILEYQSGAQDYHEPPHFPFCHPAGLGLQAKPRAARSSTFPQSQFLPAPNLPNHSVTLS